MNKVTGNYHFVSWMKEGMKVEMEEDEENPLFTVGQFYAGEVEGLTEAQIQQVEERVRDGYVPLFTFTRADRQVRML